VVSGQGQVQRVVKWRAEGTADRLIFASLVLQRMSAMRGVAAAIVGWPKAEDAAQEAILLAWQAWDTLGDLDALRPWLLRIRVNRCLQWRREPYGKRRASTQFLDDGGIEELATLATDPGTSDHTGALDLRSVSIGWATNSG